MGAPEIPPYRMNHLMKTASKMTDTMINGVLHMTYQEMEIVLRMMLSCIEEIKAANEAAGKKEDTTCS